jgi:hypothetical protein
VNLEPEEVDIGLSTSDQIPDFIEEGDIAADADGLDSDDEALSDEDDVIIQTDSDGISALSIQTLQWTELPSLGNSSNAYRTALLVAIERKTDAGVQATSS